MAVLRSLLFNIFFFSWTALSVLVMALLLPFHRNAMAKIVDIWARVLSFALKVLVGLSFEVRGRENIVDGPAVYAAKHQSAWDTFVYFLILKDPSYVLKKELLSIPVWGWCATKYGAVPVDRDGGGAALKKMLSDVADRLAWGMVMVIFPEGTRTQPGDRRPYHPGIAAIYGKVDVPVVPVALNSGLFWGRRRFAKRPGVITVEFLPKIEKGKRRREFMSELETVIEAASDRLIDEAVAADPRLADAVVKRTEAIPSDG
jgi:1-acyl-sn-glycerol-3-phosphate acyltransferase